MDTRDLTVGLMNTLTLSMLYNDLGLTSYLKDEPCNATVNGSNWISGE